MKQRDWIAVDWGTSRARAWAMSSTGEVLASAESEQGMSQLTAAGYEPELTKLIEPWLNASQKQTVVCCGMIGSRQGWIEVPYESVPCKPALKLTAAPVTSERIEVFICSGVKQDHPGDVMRGEETQIAGLLAAQPEFDGMVCLPGTHSKWARIGRGEICEFQTFMTGELFGLLADRSVLRHSVGQEGWDGGAFVDGVNTAMSDPASVASKLFSIRAEGLLHGLDASIARARLSGYLVGWELAASRRWWHGRQEVAIIGAANLSTVYESALRAQGVQSNIVESERMTLAGLHSAFKQLNS